MNAVVNHLASEIERLGYGPKGVARNYRFADVLTSEAPTREVPLAAFTDTPFSYRTAAFGVLTDQHDAAASIEAHRALGAPLWFCIQGDNVQLWRLKKEGGAVLEATQPVAELDRLFAVHRADWAPDRIQQAKLAGLWDGPEQLDFADIGLLRSIEANVQTRLGRVIEHTLKALVPDLGASRESYRRAYRVCFYLLAAKIILDREHPVSRSWQAGDARAVLRAVSAHYQLRYGDGDPEAGFRSEHLHAAWSRLQQDISFANISADDLAFVYENTLVAPETRKRFGTHSTPRAVAEFLVSRLRIGALGVEVPPIYEPFCGAAVLLVAALASLRNHLPRDWTEERRHAFLVSRLHGADLDPFACEVASLSLVLADYPSANGWDIRECDLFVPGTITNQTPHGGIVLCNPPFEDFSLEERTKYSPESVRKPEEVLRAVLAAQPTAIGFVMPQGITTDRNYGPLRQQIERCFTEIEMVALPDRVFVQSQVESALLIAHTPRSQRRAPWTQLRSATVSDAERDTFLAATARLTFRKQRTLFDEATTRGDLWIPELAELWDYLKGNQTLGDIAQFHRGIEWKSGYQTSAKSMTSKPGFRRGLHGSRDLLQFLPPETVWLDCNPSSLRRCKIPDYWDAPKVIINAGRKSRGPWRLTAFTDYRGLVFSQQLVGCWVRDNGIPLPVVEAILNSPIASAFVEAHNPRKGLRIETLNAIPLPRRLQIEDVLSVVSEIRALLNNKELFSEDREQQLQTSLLTLDALLLEAYELPPRLERQLLVRFSGYPRPVACTFESYPIDTKGMARSLRETLESRFEHNREAWIQEVFQPLSSHDRAIVSHFLP